MSATNNASTRIGTSPQREPPAAGVQCRRSLLPPLRSMSPRPPRALLLSLLLASSTCANDEPAPAPADKLADDGPAKGPKRRPQKPRTKAPDLPLEVIRDRLAESEIALIARATLGDRQAAIVWPAFKDGTLQDAEIIALAFQRSGLRWLPIGERVTLSQSDGRRELAALLGGQDFTLRRSCGRDLDALVDGVQDDLKAFAQARKRGEPAAALDAYKHYAESFAFDAIALDSRTTEWLIAASDDPTFELQLQTDDDGDWLTADIVRRGQSKRARLPLVRCAGGWALGAILP